MSADRPVDSNLSDEVLVELVVRRDVDAFVTLYDRYAAPVYAMANYMLGRDEAEEAIQEVFLQLWNRAASYDPRRGPFRPWFMTVARHHILSRLRGRKREQQITVAAADIDRVLANVPDPNVNLESESALREQSEEVLVALRELPAEQRRVLVLAYFGGLSQSEIARQLQTPLGTVKKRTKLGLEKLRASLRRSRPEPDHRQSDRDRSETVRHDL